MNTTFALGTMPNFVPDLWFIYRESAFYLIGLTHKYFNGRRKIPRRKIRRTDMTKPIKKPPFTKSFMARKDKSNLSSSFGGGYKIEITPHTLLHAPSNFGSLKKKCQFI